MGKNRKKRSTKSVPKPAPSLIEGGDGLHPKVQAEDSDGHHQQEQVNSNAPLPNNVDAAPFANLQNKPSVDGDSFLRPRKASSIPCSFFQRGYCRNGDYCRFQHSEAVSTSAEPLHSAANVPPPNMHSNVKNRVPSEKNCPPGMCLDWYLTGSCPRYRTCRYAHLFDHHDVGGRHTNMESGSNVDSGMGLGFEYMISQLLDCDLSGSRGGRGDDEMSQRMTNGGFTDDDVYELSLQGIKPWDPEAWDALAVLNGWDMDDMYDSDDYGF